MPTSTNIWHVWMHLRPTVPFPILKGLEIEYCPDSRDYYSFLLKRKSWIICCWVSIITRRTTVPTFLPSRFLKKIGTRGYIKYAHSVKKRWKPDTSRFSRIPMYFSTIPIPGMTTARRPVISSKRRRPDRSCFWNLMPTASEKASINPGNDHRWPYPYADFWEKKSPNFHSVLIGSDCHDPAFMWDSLRRGSLPDRCRVEPE